MSKNPSTLNWNNHPWREVANGTTYHPPSVQSWAPLPDSLTPIHTWTNLDPTSHVSANWDTPSKASWMMVETFSRNWNKSSCLWYSTWRRAFIIFIGCLWLSRGLPWQLGFLFVLFSSLSVFPLLLSPYPAASLWFCVRGRGRRFLLQRERRTCLPSTHQPLTAPPWSLHYSAGRLFRHVWWIYKCFQATSWVNFISTLRVGFFFFFATVLLDIGPQLNLVFLPQRLSACLQTSQACLEAHSLPSPRHTILPASPPHSFIFNCSINTSGMNTCHRSLHFGSKQKPQTYDTALRITITWLTESLHPYSCS